MARSLGSEHFNLATIPEGGPDLEAPRRTGLTTNGTTATIFRFTLGSQAPIGFRFTFEVQIVGHHQHIRLKNIRMIL